MGILSYSSSSQSKDDDGSSSSDDEKRRKKQRKPEDKTTETAAQRLNRLLGTMQTQTDQLSSTDFPRPGDANRRRREAIKQDTATNNVIAAAKNIASMLGTSESEKKQTESELLTKLLGQRAEGGSDVTQGDDKSSPAGAASGDKELNLR